MPAGSRMDFLLLAKAKSIRTNGNTSVLTYLRTERFKPGCRTDNLQSVMKCKILDCAVNSVWVDQLGMWSQRKDYGSMKSPFLVYRSSIQLVESCPFLALCNYNNIYVCFPKLVSSYLPEPCLRAGTRVTHRSGRQYSILRREKQQDVTSSSVCTFRTGQVYCAGEEHDEHVNGVVLAAAREAYSSRKQAFHPATCVGRKMKDPAGIFELVEVVGNGTYGQVYKRNDRTKWTLSECGRVIQIGLRLIHICCWKSSWKFVLLLLLLQRL
ncbi:hypothetical protein BTVI_125288 [Pitangus sulphuratus]|nr:hypothetical protein BTVI_125288 [Pitangus sulphuratus]